MSLNLAKSACQEMGLELAKLESNDENIGLQRMLSKIDNFCFTRKIDISFS